MTPHKLSAFILSAVFLCAPFAQAAAANAMATALSAAQQDDTPSDAEQAMFTRGQRLYNEKRYEQAATLFKDFLKTYPNSIIADLTLLWLGRAYIALNRLADAEQVAQQLRGIRDTPFVEIYEGELQTARQSAPRAPAPSTSAPRAATQQQVAGASSQSNRPTARPSPTPVHSTPTLTTPQQSAATSALPHPSPTPRMVGRIVYGNRGPSNPAQTPTPRPMPAQIATARPPATGEAAVVDRSQPKNESTPAPPMRRVGGRRPARGARGTQSTPASDETQIATRQPIVSPTPLTLATPLPQRQSQQSRRPAQPSAPATVREQIASNSPAPRAATPPAAEPSESVTTAPPITSTGPATQEGFSVTVKQVPALALALRRPTLVASPSQSVQLPLAVTNTGNKEDQFRLETDLPAEFQPTFSLASGGQDSGLPILVTPQLQRGQTLEVLLNLHVPETATDGLQRRFIVRAASQSDFQVSKVSDAALSVVAAALAGSSSVGRESVQPGETFTQTITVKNQGSALARGARADFVFSPDFELVNANPLPLFYDSASRTAVWSLGDLDSRASRDINVTLRAVPDALAANRPVGRGIMRTQSLTVPSNFDGPVINVGRVPRARIEAASAGLTATPGDIIYLPFMVRNPGNYPETYDLRITAPGAPQATIYADTNGDGQHQDGEPSITQTTAIDPRGGQFPLLLRVEVPRSTSDRAQFAYNVVARSVSTNRAASEATTVLTVAAPRVRVRTEQVTDTNAPGDVLFYRLVLINEGSGLAKNLVVNEVLPPALQFIRTDPQLGAQDAGEAQRIVWRVSELAPGDTSVLLVNVRLRPDLAAGGTITTTRTWSYQDTNGNTYQNR